MSDEADTGILPGLGIPCQLPGNTDDRDKSHVAHSPSVAPIQMHVHTLTQAFREGSDVAEWPLAHVTTSRHSSPHGLRSWLSRVLLGAGYPSCYCFWLPVNKSSMHSEVPRLPSLEKSQGSTCFSQPTPPGQGKIEDTSPLSTRLRHQSEGCSSSTQSVSGLSPTEGRKEGGRLRLSARGKKAPLNQNCCGFAPALRKQEG